MTHDLSSYLAETGASQTALAERLGISRSFLSLLVSGQRKPSLELAFQIQDVTGGKVCARSFVTFEADGDDSPPAQDSLENEHPPAS